GLAPCDEAADRIADLGGVAAVLQHGDAHVPGIDDPDVPLRHALFHGRPPDRADWQIHIVPRGPLRLLAEGARRLAEALLEGPAECLRPLVAGIERDLEDRLCPERQLV